MSELDKQYTSTIRKNLHAYASVRRDVIKYSGDALHHAKRAIFALHRGELDMAKMKILEAESLIKELHKKYKKYPSIREEGAYKAALEEIVEAVLFYAFVFNKKLTKLSAFEIDEEVFLAGLCDVPGELYRYAIQAATNHDSKTVARCLETAKEILSELMEFDFTKYLRTKFDQAKGAVHKLEIVRYEISLREKNS